jgi:hypothetical protein
MSNNYVHLRYKKKGDPGWQSKETSPKHEHIQLVRQQRRRILTSMRLEYEIIGNRLYSPLQIRYQ